MSTESSPKPSKAAAPAKAIARLVGKSKQVGDLVAQAADELSTVNTVLQKEFDAQEPTPAVEAALEKSEAVEDKVQDASEKLLSVNRALKKEVKERHTLEGELAEVKEQGEADRHASLHDVLTGLPNRALFTDRVEQGIALATRLGWNLAVLFVDLDDFKKINDTHGHDVGDGVLQTIAQRLKESTRSDDTISRFGGDEFLYLLLEIRDEHDAISIAEKIINLIQEPCDFSKPGCNILLNVKASVGIALFPNNGASAEALIKSADTAMYLAKRSGSGYALAP